MQLGLAALAAIVVAAGVLVGASSHSTAYRHVPPTEAPASLPADFFNVTAPPSKPPAAPASTVQCEAGQDLGGGWSLCASKPQAPAVHHKIPADFFDGRDQPSKAPASTPVPAVKGDALDQLIATLPDASLSKSKPCDLMMDTEQLLTGLPNASVSELVSVAARSYGFPPELALRVAEQERSGNPAARKEGIGIMQLTPDTAKALV